MIAKVPTVDGRIIQFAMGNIYSGLAGVTIRFEQIFKNRPFILTQFRLLDTLFANEIVTIETSDETNHSFNVRVQGHSDGATRLLGATVDWLAVGEGEPLPMPIGEPAPVLPASFDVLASFGRRLLDNTQ